MSLSDGPSIIRTSGSAVLVVDVDEIPGLILPPAQDRRTGRLVGIDVEKVKRAEEVEKLHPP